LLKTSGWTTEPLDNVEHDFVTDLLNKYLKDLEGRMISNSKQGAGFCRNLRKTVELDTMEDVVNV